MNTSLKWFKRVVWLGVILNMFFALPALFTPNFVLSSLGLTGEYSTVWLQNAGMLVFSVSLFYIPAAIEPVRFATYAWILVFARFIAGAFWIYIVATSTQASAFRSMLLTDVPLGIILAILLHSGLPAEERLHAQSIKKMYALGEPILCDMNWESTGVLHGRLVAGREVNRVDYFCSCRRAVLRAC